MKKIVFFLFILTLLVLPIHYIGYAAVKEVVLEERVITDSTKSWTVHFNEEVNLDSVKKRNIYIMEENGQILEAKLSTNGKSVTISPESSYNKGQNYLLVIMSNLKSTHNVFLSEKTVVPFVYDKEGSGDDGTTTTSTNSETIGVTSKESSKATSKEVGSKTSSKKNSKITSKIKKHQHFIELTVTVSDEIVKVKAGRDELDYKGNNQFLLYKPGLEPGDKLTIKGYSTSGKVIESKEVSIP